MNQKSFFPAAKSVQIEFLNNEQLAYRRIRTARVRRYFRPFQAGLGSPEHARVTTAAGRMLPVGARDAHFQEFRLRIGGRREASRCGYGRNQGGLKPQSSARQWHSRRMSSAGWPAGAGFSAHDRAAALRRRSKVSSGFGSLAGSDRHGAPMRGMARARPVRRFVRPKRLRGSISRKAGGASRRAKRAKSGSGFAAARLPSRAGCGQWRGAGKAGGGRHAPSSRSDRR